MTRIAPSPMPGLELERSADRGADRSADRMIDRAGEPAPASAGTPFRAALRKADKAVARRESGDAPAPLAPPPAMAAPAPRPLAHDNEARDARARSVRPTPEARPGSIADVVASSMEVPSASPGTALAGQARGLTALAARAQGRQAAADLGATGDAMLDATLAGAGLATPAVPSATVVPPPPAGAALQDSPVTTWVAAAVARAIGSLGGAASASASASASAAAAAQAADAANAADSVSAAAQAADAASAANSASATAGIASPAVDLARSALSPLEQAVHDLLGRATEHDADEPRAARPASTAPDTASVSLHVLTADRTLPASDVRAPGGPAVQAAAPAQLPEPPANPSHVHLVLDDGPERTVVTVAVRGSEVRVALRAGDDATTAALARNAASLDHAMRARGLALGELTAERGPRDQRPARDPEPRERRAPDAEPFVLEEKP